MSTDSSTIKRLSSADLPVILGIVNTAAKKYGGVIPADCYHDPYMTGEEMAQQMTSMIFYGWSEDDKLIGVAGFQPVADVTLIRHVYVLPEHQGMDVGTKLLDRLKSLTRTRRLLVGTWAAAYWALGFYQKYGFDFLPHKAEVLARYWPISQRQIETSTVLGMELEP